MRVNFKILSFFFPVFLLVSFFVFADLSLAIEAIVQCGLDPNSPSETCQVRDIFETASRVLNYMFTLGGAIAVCGVVYGGFLMVTSGGNADRVAQGKKAIINSLIGLALVLLSVLGVRTVFDILQYRGDDPLDPNSIPVQSSAPPTTGKSSDGPNGVTTNPTDTSSNSNISVNQVPNTGGGQAVGQNSTLPGVPTWSGADPYPALVWKSGDAGIDAKLSELQKAVNDFNVAWKSQGGGVLSVRQAFRPADYQAHIRGVWEANRILNGKSYTEGYGCQGYAHTDPGLIKSLNQAQKDLLAGEVKKHQSNSDTPPACRSDHALGIAVDITPPPATSGTVYEKWMEVGESVGLCHYIAGDEPHFALKKYLPAGTNCRVK